QIVWQAFLPARLSCSLPPGVEGSQGQKAGSERMLALQRDMYMCNQITYMHRTTILLSHELRRDTAIAARRRGISLSEMIRRLLTAAVRGTSCSSRKGDPLFQLRHLMRSANPSDVAAKHDDYLYGPRSRSRRK